MKKNLEKLSEMKIDKDRVKVLEDNALQIIKEPGCLIVEKTGNDEYTIVSILEDKTQEEVLKFIDEYK